MSEALSIIISFLALTVAVYGIFERMRAADASLRVRITELLAAIEALNVEQAAHYEDQGQEQEGQEEGPAQYTEAAILGRRALLTYQVVDLLQQLERVRRRFFGKPEPLTLTEYISLADSLMRCGDYEVARSQFEWALKSAKPVSPRVLKAAYRSFAATLFSLGKIDEAREYFKRSVNLGGEATEADRWDAFMTCLTWLESEKALKEGVPDVPVRQARRIAESSPEGLKLIMLMRLRGKVKTTIYADGEYSEQIIGFDE